MNNGEAYAILGFTCFVCLFALIPFIKNKNKPRSFSKINNFLYCGLGLVFIGVILTIYFLGLEHADIPSILLFKTRLTIEHFPNWPRPIYALIAGGYFLV